MIFFVNQAFLNPLSKSNLGIYRFPMAPMIVAHPAALYPQMPWTGGDGGPALLPVVSNPSDYQQMLQNQQNRPGSVDSESSSSKNSSRRGSMNQKFVPSVMQNKKMQLGKFIFL